MIDEHFLPFEIDAEDLSADLVSPRFRRLTARRRRQGDEDRDSAETVHMVNSTK